MSALQFKLLGYFRILRDDGAEVLIPSRKGKAMLAYLALCPGHRESRRKLASLLWGERFDEQARGSLRQCLSELRRDLNKNDTELLSTDGDWVTLNPELVRVDALEFEALSGANDRATLQTIVDLYDGDFFADFDLDEPDLSEWVRENRERLRENAAVCLLKLVENLTQDGEFEPALNPAQRLVALDPLREDGHRWLMRLYEQLGRRNDALRQYQICADTVSENLAVEPEAETKALFAHIRGDDTRVPSKNRIDSYVAPTNPAASAKPATTWTRVWYAGAVVICAVAALTAALMWQFGQKPETNFPLPDKPSIAIIPFANMSGQPAQDYFSDGITADIIAKLSRVPHLFVVDQHSSFSYKSKPISARQIGRELGVRYIASGQIQVAGNRVRITANLVDGVEGQQIWTEQFRGSMEDLFSLQDKVTDSIAGNLLADIMSHEESVVREKPTKNLKAYDYVLRGRQYLFELTPSSNEAARNHYQKAVELDPKYARAHAYLAWSYLNDMRLGWADDPELALRRAFAAAKRAVALNHEIPEGHEALGDTYLWAGQHNMAITELNRALELNPNGASIYAKIGDIYTWAGQPALGIENLDQATVRNRRFPYTYLWYRAHAHFVAGRYEQAIGFLRKVNDRKANFVPAHLYLAVIFGDTDRMDEAQKSFKTAMSLHPGLAARLSPASFPYKNPAHEKLVSETLAKIAASLR